MRFSIKKILLSSLLPCFLFFGCSSTPPTQSEPQPETTPFVPVIDGVWQTDDADISRLNPDKKLVALTFDDAPTASLDALLEVFIEFNKTHPNCPASATLFCNGARLSARTKESLYTAYALGLELGNHTFSHHDLTTLPSQKVVEEIGLVDAILEEIDGKPLHLFRAPYGRTNEQVVNLVKTPVIDWYIDTLDWRDKSSDALINAVFERLEDGAIVLMHDGYPSSVEGVKKLLPALEKAGYQAVSVSQLAKAHRCRLKTGKVYTRARKQKA